MHLNVAEIEHLIPPTFNPASDFALEEFKQFGRALTATGATLEDRAKGILIEVFCHYQRSRNASLAGRRKHPNFREYATHWLFADRSTGRSDVLTYLKAQLDAPERMHIAPGKSYWFYRPRAVSH